MPLTYGRVYALVWASTRGQLGRIEDAMRICHAPIRSLLELDPTEDDLELELELDDDGFSESTELALYPELFD